MGVQNISGPDIPDRVMLRPARPPASEGTPEPTNTGDAQQALGSSGPGKAQPAPKPVPRMVRGGTRLRIDSGTDQIVAQILNESKEVLKQVPPEEYLKVVSKVRRLKGLLFDEQA